jgi:hypothetical protein
MEKKMKKKKKMKKHGDSGTQQSLCIEQTPPVLSQDTLPKSIDTEVIMTVQRGDEQLGIKSSRCTKCRQHVSKQMAKSLNYPALIPCTTRIVHRLHA